MKSTAEYEPVTNNKDSFSPPKGTAVYKRRWYVLGVFCYCSVVEATIWNTWGPITETTKVLLGWTNSNIALVTNLCNIAFIIFSIPVCMLMDRKGLRFSLLVCSVMFVIGTGIRCITLESKALLGLAYTCAIVFGTASIVPFGGPSLVSAVWFPLYQRTTATAIASTFNWLGVALSFLLGPYIVTNPEYGPCNKINGTVTGHNQTVKKNMNNKIDEVQTSAVCDLGTFEKFGERTVLNMDALESGLRKFMFVYLGLTAFQLILTLIYFPVKPPTPPSYTASIERPDYREAGLRLLKNRNLWLVVIACGLPSGVLSCWATVLDVNLEPIGVTQTDAGWIGFWHIISGCVTGLIAARFSDIFMKRRKVILLILYILSAASCVWFTLLYNNYLAFNLASVYASGILMGAFANATMPLFFEISCEASYPVAEGVTGGFFTLVYNMFGTIFLFILTIEDIGVVWMNWALLGSFLISIPILIAFPEQLKRTNTDFQYIVT